MITWNKELTFILSDVDETIADLYTRAAPEMCSELEKLLSEGVVLFLITGQSTKSMQWRITDHIRPELRKQILMAHCSGAEVWGFNVDGSLHGRPFYSLYEHALTNEQKKRWRDVVAQIVQEFKLEVHPASPLPEFKHKAGNNPLAVMLEDRGPQITLEVINGYDLSPQQEAELEVNVPNTHGNLDLRIPILERIDQLFQAESLPITPRLAGVFAIDLAIKGVSKSTAIQYIMADEEALAWVGLAKAALKPEHMEVWGDKFSTIRGGTDRHISEALPQAVRSIDFREENPAEFLEGYHTVVWDGTKHLHEGLLEFLQLRNK